MSQWNRWTEARRRQRRRVQAYGVFPPTHKFPSTLTTVPLVALVEAVIVVVTDELSLNTQLLRLAREVARVTHRLTCAWTESLHLFYWKIQTEVIKNKIVTGISRRTLMHG